MPLDEVSFSIIRKLEGMVEDVDPDTIHPKRKAISALFPYAVLLEQGGQRRMLDAISHTARATRGENFIWYRAKPFIASMFYNPNPPSLNWVLGLILPRVPWDDEPHNKDVVAVRAAAALGVPHPERASWSVIDELLLIAFLDSVHPRIPGGFQWQPKSTGGDLIDRVRALGDVGILKSYLFLVWSTWDPIDDQSGGLSELQKSIREDFGGIGMGRHRDDLAGRLDHALQELDWTYHMERREGFCGEATQRKEQCEEFKRVLLEVDGEAVKTLTRMLLTSICFRLLMPPDTYRIPPDLHVRSASPVSMISRSETFLRLTTPPVRRGLRLFLLRFLTLPRTAPIYLGVHATPVSRWTMG